LRQRKYKSTYPDINELARDLYEIGNNEPTFTITLNSSTTVSTITNPLVGADSVITMTPLTAAAGTESWYVSARNKGAFGHNSFKWHKR
jgi:hypothetical protein